MMNLLHMEKIAEELGLTVHQVEAAGRLLLDGATVPFIARYRKEATGSLDEVAITSIRDRMAQLEDLDKRRVSILHSLEERELLTDELKGKILAAETLTTLEDIYLPYRPKRRTRATIAREKGLEPLARIIFEQKQGTDPLKEAAAFVDPEKGVEGAGDALAGCRDIMAEWINEDQEAREKMRRLFAAKGLFRSRVIPGKETDGAKYRDYFDWEEPVSSAPSHRILAMRRGEKEGFLLLHISPPEEEALNMLKGLFVKEDGPAAAQVSAAAEDCYRRLLSPSMETELRLDTKKRADSEAVRVFAGNLRELLLSPPLGEKRVLAVDPGIRTGCKVVCLDSQGKLLHTDTVYPFRSQRERADAALKIQGLLHSFSIEAVAVGNGTAGRETEAFMREIAAPAKVPVIMVNESGASVYSASAAARAEFPDLDVSIRGAVSIGRRLMDPLAELVKIDPKSIGVGQYQHDVNQQDLKRALDDVVVSCVNAVGVEVNTASEQLLGYVSGLGSRLAKNIVAYRNEKGALKSRDELKKISWLGPKAFEQAAGFLRIRDGANPLDASAVHPESYPVVEAMAADLGCNVIDLIRNKSLRAKIDPSRYVSDGIGLPTLRDILAELEKPGRDPRSEFENFHFQEGIEKIEDLKPGMRLPGVVTNVTAFGAFVDVGVHQDGLVHISCLAEGFVKDPHTVVKVHQKVTVTVLDVDLERRRISLSMKEAGGQAISDPGKGAGSPSEQTRKSRAAGRTKAGPFNNPFRKAFHK